MRTLLGTLAVCSALFVTPLARGGQHAFIWNQDAGMQDLGTLGGIYSYAVAINDSGQTVGWSYLADNVTYHAFVWTPSEGMVDLGPIPGGIASQAWAINSSGDIAGDGTDSDGFTVPFYWSPEGGYLTLPRNRGGQNNMAFGINDVSDVTGQRFHGNDVLMAFLWSFGEPNARDIGALPGGRHSDGMDINNQRHITGASDTELTGAYTAFFWSISGGFRDLGRIGSSFTAGEAINDRDEVVGMSQSGPVGFYWNQRTGMIILQSLGRGGTAAFGINENGMIAGYALTRSGLTHAVLWKDYKSAPRDLGTVSDGFSSFAQGINNLGQVVGYVDVP